MSDARSPSDDKGPVPGEVFTPRAPVGDLMFVNRLGNKLGERLSQALSELGAQVVVYGDTGVGKTSLVTRIGGTAIARVECQDAKSFRDLIHEAFGALGEVQELRFSETHEASSGVEAEGGLGWVASLKARLRSNVSQGTTRDYEIFQTPLIDVLIESMQDSEKKILFFDNFETISSDAVKKGIAELMVALSDRSRESGNIKVVVAGIAESAASLVSLSSAASRRTVDIAVPPMPDEELTEIVTRGMQRLGIDIESKEIREIVHMSAGYPYVTHLVSLHAARLAENGRVTGEVLEAAVAAAVQDFGLDFQSRYALAVENSGPIRPRQRILHAMASSAQREFRYKDVLKAVQERYGGSTDYTYFNAAIGRLCTDGQGGLLRKRSISGTNQYSFANPLARSFIRLASYDEQSTAEQ